MKAELSSRNHIVMLKRELLHPHPDNPRKDLGDLSELRNSILEHGIMQNLTVVPDGKGYKILIGHRRFAASEGIEDLLPCVISEGLSDREQLGIMLVENMQRSDLTYIEQAHGFQMMMDLGETVDTISEKTGFSKATVKHRLAINELDPKAIKEAEECFQLTIADYMALEKVKDIKKRNEILTGAGNSRDLQVEVEEYVTDQIRQEHFDYYKKFFEAAGWTDETENDKWFYYKDGYKENGSKFNRFDISQQHVRLTEEQIKNEMDKIKGEVHFSFTYHTIFVRTYKEPKGKKNEAEEEKKRKALESRCRKNRSALKEIRTQICDAYMDFILNTDFKFKDDKEENKMFDSLLGLCICCDGLSITLHWIDENTYSIYDKLSNKNYNKRDSKENPILKEFCNYTPFWQVLINVWFNLASSYGDFMDSFWSVKTDILEAHKEFIDFLKPMGFHIKEEWKPVIDGTSELYKKEDE